MMYSFPFRRTLIQCIHIFLTADFTFMPRNCVPTMDVDVGVAIDGGQNVERTGWRIGRC